MSADGARAIPEWLPRVDRVVTRAARAVRLLGAATPIDAARERARIVATLEAGDHATPEWSYRFVDYRDVCAALAEVRRAIEGRTDDPLAACYLGRVNELALEAELSMLAGRIEFSDGARRRFHPVSAQSAADALALAKRWIALAHDAPRDDDADVLSDADDARSLLSRMRAEIGRQRLPFSVVARAALAPLAATGDDVILVATGRRVSSEDVERTVVHEIFGHAMPRARADRQPIGVFAFGTACGADEQEGRALTLEDTRGFLSTTRKRQLAARHLAVCWMLAGATFHDVATRLIDDHGVTTHEAVLVAERAYRGGDGERAGLGRERVYLESYLRVKEALSARPEDDRVMGSGQVALAEIPTLRRYVR